MGSKDNSCVSSENVWSIILSGGEGKRLEPLVKEWLGYHRPKQYCTFIGSRSMLQHTICRARQICGPSRIVIVTVQSHRQYIQEELKSMEGGKVLFQPENRDTAAEIMLALAYIRKHDPNATVFIFPADHFIFPEQRFISVLKSMLQASERLPNQLLVLGISPGTARYDYGLVELGSSLGWFGANRVQTVKNFSEKPPQDLYLKMLAKGAMWNTFIFASPQNTLWDIGFKTLPHLMALMEKYVEACDTPREEAVLEEIFSAMPACNFSSEVLEKIPRNLALFETWEILWSDWGRQERIEETLWTIGKKAAFQKGLQSQAAVSSAWM